MELSDYSTKALTEELIKRIGVESMEIAPYKKAYIETDNQQFNFDGPAIVIVNID